MEFVLNHWGLGFDLLSTVVEGQLLPFLQAVHIEVLGLHEARVAVGFCLAFQFSINIGFSAHEVSFFIILLLLTINDAILVVSFKLHLVFDTMELLVKSFKLSFIVEARLL